MTSASRALNIMWNTQMDTPKVVLAVVSIEELHESKAAVLTQVREVEADVASLYDRINFLRRTVNARA